jgi:hypothetical protein
MALYRGLSTFISDVRNCACCSALRGEESHPPNVVRAPARAPLLPAVGPLLFPCALAGKTKEAEQQRVDKELANIRAAFSTVRTSDGAGAGCGAGERRRSPTGHAPTARACFAPPPPAVRGHDAVRAAQVLVEDAVH